AEGCCRGYPAKQRQGFSEAAIRALSGAVRFLGRAEVVCRPRSRGRQWHNATMEAPMKPLKRIENFFAAMTGSIAVVFLAFLVVRSSIDATMRFLSNRLISGVFELAELAMVICVFFGLGWAQQDRKHTRATMLVERLGPRARSIAD